MSIPKPRQFTYFERVKESFSAVQEPDTKLLCNDLLNFIDKCAAKSQTRVLDFTSKKCEEHINQFLLADREFIKRIIDNFSKFSDKGIFDPLSKEIGMVKKDIAHESRSRALIKAIERQYYQILCLSSLYCPPELQQSSIEKLCCTFLYRHKLDSLFGFPELTAWTSLLLLINPVKLKQQCDGSVEIFSYFDKVLSSQSSSCPGLGIPHELDEIEFVNEGINNFALEFLLAFVVQSQTFCGGDDFAFSIELIDSILKNFICYFPNKLNELYSLCEEELQIMEEYQNQENNENYPNGNSYFSNENIIRGPNFAHLHFKVLLELIAALYESEKSSQLIQLSMEFTNPNCEGLCDFIYRGRTISAPALKIAYLEMLKSLCKNSQSAEVFFNLFK